MKRFFIRNLGWKLLSLAAAVLLWIAVASEPELATFISAPVEYQNLAPDVEISSEVVESVMLEVRGPSAELSNLPYARQRYAVVLDMSDVESGTHTFTIDQGNVRLPRGIRLVRAVPARVRVACELSQTRSVPVEVRVGELPAGLRVVETSADPPAVTIVGPASHVARINAVETDPIEVTPDAGSQEYQVGAYVNDPRVRIEDPPQIGVKVTVAKK
jgi:YbbR domain-containing protein